MMTTIARTAKRTESFFDQAEGGPENDARLLLVKQVQQGSLTAQRRLIESCVPLLNRLARAGARSRRDVTFEELVSEGAIAIVRAARSYDFDSGVPFVAYAATWIKYALRGAERSLKQTIRLPAHIQTKRNRIEAACREIEAETGRRPLPPEIAKAVGLSVSEVLLVLKHRSDRVNSIDAPTAWNDGPQDRAGATATRVPGLQQQIRSLLASLSVEERALIARRFGLGCQTAGTIRSLARQMGVTPRQVRRDLDRAIQRLRIEAGLPERNGASRNADALDQE